MALARATSLRSPFTIELICQLNSGTGRPLEDRLSSRATWNSAKWAKGPRGL
jgi:hypothetical protein